MEQFFNTCMLFCELVVPEWDQPALATLLTGAALGVTQCGPALPVSAVARPKSTSWRPQASTVPTSNYKTTHSHLNMFSPLDSPFYWWPRPIISLHVTPSSASTSVSPTSFTFCWLLFFWADSFGVLPLSKPAQLGLSGLTSTTSPPVHPGLSQREALVFYCL